MKNKKSLIGLVVFLCIAIFFSGVLKSKELVLNGKNETEDSFLANLKNFVEKSEYEIKFMETKYKNLGKCYQAPNRQNGFRVFFLNDRITIVPRGMESKKWELIISFFDERKNVCLNKKDVKVTVSSNKLEYDWGFIKEWYINDKKGLEQGFIINKKPKRKDSLGLNIDLLIEGNLVPKVSKDCQSVTFFAEDSVKVLNYGSLLVKDAKGKILKSKFEQRGEMIRIAIDDTNAVYPVFVDPVLDTPTWTYKSGQNVSDFGYSVSTAGDVNGDGYSDVIIGAPRYDNGQTDEGRVFVFYGSSNGLASTPDWTAESNQGESNFGLSVSTAGDVNGDGYSDVIIGADGYDNGQLNEGRAYAYYGSSTGLSTTPDWIVESNQATARMGYSVSNAGDVNGDGYGDVIVGSYYHTAGQFREGKVYVYYGSSSGLDTSPAWSKVSGQQEAYLGRCVSTAGDVNRDGYSDIIVAAPYYDNSELDEGRVYVYHGSSKGLSVNPDWTAEININDAHFGWSVSDAGDVNGDGYGDVLVSGMIASDEPRTYLYYGSQMGLSSNYVWSGFGASCSSCGDVNGDGYGDVILGFFLYEDDVTDEGGNFLYLGSSSGLPSSPNWYWTSNEGYAYLGNCSSAGDVNGDGFSDILLGAWAYGYNVGFSEGAAFLFYGAPFGISANPNWSYESNQNFACYDTDYQISVSSAGDVNGDGFDEILVGVPFYEEEGFVFAFYGSSTGVSLTPDWIGRYYLLGANYGFSVAKAGDINGDGYGDIIIGANKYTNGQTNEGAVFVYYGSPTGLSTTPDWMYESNTPLAEFGRSVASAGDVNGDYFYDVIVGAPGYYNGSGIIGGAAFVFTGSAQGLSSNPSWMAGSDQFDASFGFSVSTIGDPNGDHFDDVVVGAPFYDSEGSSDDGAVFVYRGSSSGLQNSYACFVEGNQSNEYLGYSVSGGDVGYASATLVGAPKYSLLGSPTNSGAVLYWRGDLCNYLTPLNYLYIPQLDAYCGASVALAGDLDGDGVRDIVLGCPLYTNGDHYGAIKIYYPQKDNSILYDKTVESNSPDLFGWSVSGAGDVDGDGYGDIIVGSPAYENGEYREGRASIFYGNGNTGKLTHLRQYQSDFSAPIVAPLNATPVDPYNGSFAIKFNTSIPYFGRGLAKYEIQWTSDIWSNTSSIESYESDWIDLSTFTNEQSFVISGLWAFYGYKWRVRLKFHPKYGEPIHTRWFYFKDNGSEKADVRSGYIGNYDGDSLPDSEDCVWRDRWYWSAPTEPANMLTISKEEENNIHWSLPDEETFGSVSSQVFQDVLRSTNPSDFSQAECLASDLNTYITYCTDNNEPPSGVVWYYLVKIKNICGYNMGTNSNGGPRIGRECP